MSARRSKAHPQRVPRDGHESIFAHWRKERAIRRALRGLAQQRVAAILQPGNMLVVERGPSRREPSEAALRSCHLRGWAEPIANAVRSGSLGPEGTIPEGGIYDRVGPMYRITDAGWHVLRRTHVWVIWTFLVALLSLVAAILGVVATKP
jgi:hypothetical protein